MSQLPLPNLLLAGIGKAGTTSLFWYLSQHSDVCASSVKETRFFLPASEPDGTPDGELPPLSVYAGYFRHWKGEPIRMEATPHYFRGGDRLRRAIKRTLPDARVVLTLRDPADRVGSVYSAAKRALRLPRDFTFEQFVRRCEEFWRRGETRTPENRLYWSLAGGFYLEPVAAWLDAFGERARVVFFEQLASDPKGVVEGLCRWLGIDAAVAESLDYTPQNRSVPYRSAFLQRIALKANREGRLRNQRTLKRPLRSIYYALNGTRDRERTDPEVRLHLQEIFRESNAALAEELSRRGYAELPAWLSESLVRD